MKKRYSLFSLLYGKVILPLIGFALFCSCRQDGSPSFTQVNDLMLNDSSYFETRGLNYFVFSNKYDAMFDDSKISAVEIIHHGLRTATNGDVRLNPTPGQWDKLPVFINRTVDKVAKRIDVSLEYPQYAFAYTLTGEARDGGFYLSISTDKALPDSLVGGGRTKHGVLSARILRTLLLNGRQTGTIPHLGCRHHDRYQRYCGADANGCRYGNRDSSRCSVETYHYPYHATGQQADAF